MARKKSTPPPGDSPEPAPKPKPSPKPRKARPKSPGPLVSPWEILERGGEGPLELRKARKLAIEAEDSDDPKLRVELARRALELSEDCAEALLILADHAESRKESLALCERAVEAAARVLGPEVFEEHAGHFWLLLETRAYMKARAGLANLLWASGRREEAAEHLREMLRLNPGDNQGLRYVLATWLMALDRVDELEKLLDRYDESSAAWSYTRALLAFRKSGDSAEATTRLKAAVRANKFVPAFLTGREPLPREQPAYYGFGDESEAILYVGNNLGAWKSVPGAIGWVRSREKPPRPRRKPKAVKAIGPSPAALARLRRVRSELDAWQVDFRPFPRPIEVEGERVRPWMALVASRTHDLVLAHGLSPTEPTAEMLWDLVVGAIERPAAGKPHRPSEIQVRDEPAWEALAPHFESIGMTCSTFDVLDQADSLFEDLDRHMEEAEPPGLLDMPDVTPERMARLFEAAAEFYRRAPWRAIGFETAIRIETDQFEGGPWYGIVMGQSGLTMGLVLYEDLEILREMWAGGLSDEDGARRTVALTITFDDEANTPRSEVELIRQQAWEVAAPEAYPTIYRKELGLTTRPPLAREVDLLEACLRTIPGFVARRKPDDPTPELVPATVGDGTIELRLSWIEEPS